MNNDVGRRLAAIRSSRHLTQRDLAERAHLSLSLVTKVESGARVATPSMLAACARTLGVNQGDLIQGPTEAASAGAGELARDLDLVRAALDLLDTDPDESDGGPRPLAELHGAVRHLNQVAQAAGYRRAVQELPALLADLHTATAMTTGSDQARAYALLAEAVRVGHTVGIGLGRPDLSPLALARMDQAAQHAGSAAPGLRAIREYLRITTALRSADYPACQRLHASALRHLAGTTATDPGILIARGQLHLGAAVIAARTGDTVNVGEHLAAAQRLADLTGERDLERFWVGFGPTNVTAHRVMTAVELGDPARAITEGQGIVFPIGWLPSRIGHFHLDLARAHLWTGAPDRALADLQAARAIAPQQARRHPSTRATVDALVRSRRRPDEATLAYAHWIGV